MSTEEKTQFDTLAKDMVAIKRWLPIFLFVGSIIGFTVKGTSWFKDSVATKSDIDSLRKEVRIVSTGVADIKSSFNNHIETVAINRAKNKARVDSVVRVEADLTNAVSGIQKRLNVRFVEESYPNGRNHDPIIKYDD